MNPYRLPVITTEQVMAEGEAARLHITAHDHLHQNRGYVVEDYVFNKLNKADLCDKYHASYTEIEQILDAYFDDKPVTLKIAPKTPRDISELIDSHKTLWKFLDDCEEEFLKVKLEGAKNITKLAENIGIHRSALYTKIRNYGL